MIESLLMSDLVIQMQRVENCSGLELFQTINNSLIFIPPSSLLPSTQCAWPFSKD